MLQILSVFIGLSDAAESAPSCLQFACGVHAVAISAGLEGIVLTDGDLVNMFDGHVAGVHSIQQLEDALCQAGLRTRRVSINQADIPVAQRPLIVALTGRGQSATKDHFVVIYGSSGNFIQLIDYPNPPQLVHVDELKEHWDGQGIYAVAESASLLELPRDMRHDQIILIAISILSVVVVVLSTLTIVRRPSGGKR